MVKYRSIRRAAVIGAGTMGGQIAAVIANSNTPVLLLDVVSRDTNDRDALARRAIEKLGAEKQPLSKRKLALIQPGNIEDDLEKLVDVDWVVECVPEKIKTKQETYRKVGAHVGRQALISSNTSTIPLHELKKGLQEDVGKKLCITHFFNPPWRMPLLELVTGQENDPDTMTALMRFADKRLGRNIIQAGDTPGFIANRIGLFWLLAGMEEAQKENLAIDTADAIMNGAFGFPKTGLFALADLIGLKTIAEMSGALCQFLPGEDMFRQLKAGMALVEEQCARTQDGGFYLGEGREKTVYDLEKKTYRPLERPKIHIAHWHEFLNQDTPEGRFARQTLVRTLCYAATVAPDIAEHVLQVDSAMRDGYGWKYGPFELADRLGLAWLMEQLSGEKERAPLLFRQAEASGFYRLRKNRRKEYMDYSGSWRMPKLRKNKWTLEVLTSDRKPLLQNESASLLDIGDGIACFALNKGRMRVIDEQVLDLLMQSVEKAEAESRGLVIGHDGRDFAAGLDLKLLAEILKTRDFSRIEQLIKNGQECVLRLRQAKVPTVAAVSGYTLGGGCELAMHCRGIQAHIGVQMGLVEIAVGVIPAWGGVKTHLLRAIARSRGNPDMIGGQVAAAFRQMAYAQKSANADEAFAMGLLAPPAHVTMNRERLLPDAKMLCLDMALHYAPPIIHAIEIPVEKIYHHLMNEVVACTQQEQPLMTQHRHKAVSVLAEVLSGHRAARGLPATGDMVTLTEQQLLDSERDAFMELVREEDTLDAVQAMLEK